MSFDITLNPPKICLILTTSQTGIDVNDPNYKFGLVSYLNQNNLTLDVGDVILFDIRQSDTVNQGTTTYFITDENNFIFRENAPL